MRPATKTTGSADALLSADELRGLPQRSDGRGLLRLAGHLVTIGATGWIYAAAIQRSAHPLLVAVAGIVFGFTLVTMFAAMHESVHRTAFRTQWLNNVVGWFGGLLSFYNSTYYRPYHGWHHRFTQIRGRDPELEDPKPTSLRTYLYELSGVPWWIGKLRTHFKIATGQVVSYEFLNEKTRPEVVRSVRLQLLVYGVAIAVSAAIHRAFFLTYWLLPVAAAQPLLRAILLAEHTGCSEDEDPLSNTRTTRTILPVRFLMWNMPYHAEHHRYPALPFFALTSAHERLGPHLVHLARNGYLGVHAAFLKGLVGRLRAGRAR
jgi:fatty acid desaturase